jgi:putative tryptophan/tyrosine transport system substrate-binding protein
MRPPPRCCRPISDLSRVVKISVLRYTASQDIKAKPPGSLHHKGPFHQSSGRRSIVEPRRDTLRDSQCSPCYVVQPRLSWADRPWLDDENPGARGMSPIITTLTAVVACLLLAVPLAVEAQQAGQALQTVGVLTPQRLEEQAAYPAFLETLRQLGYREGSNLRVLVRSADGKLDRLPALAAELVAARPDVIVALNTPGTRAAIEATKQIPIVMTSVGDPVGSGLVSNLARPGGNVTGVSNMVAELASKRLALLKEAVPRARRIAAMFNPGDPVTVRQLRDAERAAPALKVETRFFPVKAIEDLLGTFKQMLAWRADAALWILGQHQGFQAGSIELAASHRLPLMVGTPRNVEAGGFISYYSDPAELFGRTAEVVDRILKGAKPGDLPIEQSTKFVLTINLKTAKALGITMPPSLLLLADEVIQ